MVHSLRSGIQVTRLEQVSSGTDRSAENRGFATGILHSCRFNQTLGCPSERFLSRYLAEDWCIRRNQLGLFPSLQRVDLGYVQSGSCIVFHVFGDH